jgi:hypothetical protein
MDEISGGHKAVARPVAIGGIAALALGAGATAGYAATHHTTTVPAHTAALTNTPSSNKPTPPTPKVAHGRLWWGLGLPGGMGPLGDMLHGSAVIAKSGGGSETVDVQRGTVTEVSSSSITVKSSDGYTFTYAVNSSTFVGASSKGISSVKTGDTVFVSAIASGHTATAASVLDATAIKDGRIAFGFRPGAFKNFRKDLPAGFPFPGGDAAVQAVPNS